MLFYIVRFIFKDFFFFFLHIFQIGTLKISVREKNKVFIIKFKLQKQIKLKLITYIFIQVAYIFPVKLIVLDYFQDIIVFALRKIVKTSNIFINLGC